VSVRAPARRMVMAVACVGMVMAVVEAEPRENAGCHASASPCG